MPFSRRHFVRGAAAALAAAPFVGPGVLRAQPAVRPAPGMPAPRFISTNGIRMAVYEAGEGLPVVFVHGFPELAFSWRNQLRSYPAAGLRAIAPDMRGYGLTDRPPDVAGYAISNLCADLLGLLDALDIERAVFCGHDWGGVPVWTMPRIHPDRVAGVIGVNTPAFGGNQGAGPVRPAGGGTADHPDRELLQRHVPGARPRRGGVRARRAARARDGLPQGMVLGRREHAPLPARLRREDDGLAEDDRGGQLPGRAGAGA